MRFYVTVRETGDCAAASHFGIWGSNVGSQSGRSHHGQLDSHFFFSVTGAVKLAPKVVAPTTANLGATFRFQHSEWSVFKSFFRGKCVISHPNWSPNFP